MKKSEINRFRKFIKDRLKIEKYYLNEEDIDSLIKDGFLLEKLNGKDPNEFKTIWRLITQAIESHFLVNILKDYLKRNSFKDCKKIETGSDLEIGMIGKKRLGIDQYAIKNNQKVFIEIKDYHPDNVKAGLAHVVLMDWYLQKKKKYKEEDFSVYLAIPYTAGEKIYGAIKDMNSERESKIGLILLRNKIDEIKVYDPKEIILRKKDKNYYRKQNS